MRFIKAFSWPFVRFITMYLTPWVVSLAIVSWVAVGHHTYVAFPAGFFGYLIPFSTSYRITTGRWPDYLETWRWWRRERRDQTDR